MSKIAEALWVKQIGQCWYCGDIVGRDQDRVLGRDGWPTWPEEVQPPHVDHQHPRSRGGCGGDNLVLACAPCNEGKAARTVEEYREALQWGADEPVEFFGESAL